MADLYDSLFPVGSTIERVAVHAFVAGLSEYADGKYTRAQIIGVLNLDPEAEAEFNTICDRIDAQTTQVNKIVYLWKLEKVLLIADADYHYLDKTSMMTRINEL